MAQVDAADEQLVLEGQAQLRRARRVFQQQQAALAVADHVQVGQPAGGILAVERNRLQAVVAVADAEVEPERIEVQHRAIRQHRLRRLGRLRPELHPNAEQILAARTGRVPHQARPFPFRFTRQTTGRLTRLLRRRTERREQHNYRRSYCAAACAAACAADHRINSTTSPSLRPLL